MSLFRLIYASHAAAGLQPDGIEAILAASRRNNHRHRVSGALLFNHRCFLQVLEGDGAAVSDTFCRIAGDERHDRVLLLSAQPVTRREFAAWDMAYVPEMMLSRDVLFRYSPSARFDPCTMTAEQCLGLLLDLRDRLPTV